MKQRLLQQSKTKVDHDIIGDSDDDYADDNDDSCDIEGDDGSDKSDDENDVSNSSDENCCGDDTIKLAMIVMIKLSTQ